MRKSTHYFSLIAATVVLNLIVEIQLTRGEDVEDSNLENYDLTYDDIERQLGWYGEYHELSRRSADSLVCTETGYSTSV